MHTYIFKHAYLELPPHALYYNLKMQLSHALDGGLPLAPAAAHVVHAVEAEAGVLAGQPVQRSAHALHVALGLRLHGDFDDGIGEVHALKDNLKTHIYACTYNFPDAKGCKNF